MISELMRVIYRKFSDLASLTGKQSVFRLFSNEKTLSFRMRVCYTRQCMSTIPNGINDMKGVRRDETHQDIKHKKSAAVR